MTLRSVVTSNAGFPSVLAPGTSLQVDDATGAVTVGAAGTSNGSGVRNGASRNISANKPTAPVDCTANLTATVTQLLDAGIFTATGTGTLTMPTAQGASGVVQGLPGVPVVGDTFQFVTACSHASQIITLAVGTGWTIFGPAACLAAAGSRVWTARITSVTAGSETITVY